MILKDKRYLAITFLLIAAAAGVGYFVMTAVSADKIAFRAPVRILHNPKVTWAEPVSEMSGSLNDDWEEVEPGMALDVGSYLRTGNYGNMDISFSEGTLIRMAEDTMLSLSDLTLSKVDVALDEGTLIAKFRKLTGSESHSITTPQVVCGIRGTEIIVAIKDDVTTVFGMSGVTEVSSVHHQDHHVLLGFQQKTVIPDGDVPRSPVSMTADEVTRFRRILDSMHSLEVFFITRDLKFKPFSSELNPDSVELLEELALSIKRRKLKIEIVGHTADVGDRSSQYELSIRRAEAVKTAMISLGVKENKLTTTGFGGSRPVADNTTVEGRALNRRVEFLIRE